MYKINRKLEYSLVALQHIHGKPRSELTTAKEVSDTYQLPFDATARALQHMAQSGLLRVEHGSSGGYGLSRDLSIVTLHDLMNSVEGPRQLAKCMGTEEACEIESSCNIKSPIRFLNDKLTRFYQSISLRELLEMESSRDSTQSAELP